MARERTGDDEGGRVVAIDGAARKRGRGPGRPWPKGTSGNPNGRPKEDGHLRELCRALTEEAVGALREIVGDRTAPPNARVSAATAILDRGFGRPTQTTEISGPEGGPLPTMTWAETLREAAEVARREGEGKHGR